jgi:hypothetical protein
MIGSDLAKLMDELGMNDSDMALLAGIPMYRAIAMMRAYSEEPIESHYPMVSHLTIDILTDLQWVANEIESTEAKRQLGEFLSNELRTRGAGYVAWWILNFRRRDKPSWIMEKETPP